VPKCLKVCLGII